METPEINELELAALLHAINRPVTVLKVNREQASKIKITRTQQENGDVTYSYVRRNAET